MDMLADGDFSKKSDTIEYNHDVFFSFRGLFRLTREVIYNFVFRQADVACEKIDWRNHLPNTTTLELAPYFWIWKNNDPIGTFAKRKYEGFIECFVHYKDHIPQMDDVVLQYLEKLSQMREDDRAAAFSLCWLYFVLIGNIEEKARREIEKRIKKNADYFARCSIYTFSAIVLTEQSPADVEWDNLTVEGVVVEYRRKKYKSNSIKLPVVIELLLYLRVSALFQDSNDAKSNEWLQFAYDASNNLPDIRREIKKMMNAEATIDDSFLRNLI